MRGIPSARLCLELRGGVPARHEHRRSRRERNRRALGRRDDRSDDVGVRNRGRERSEDDGEGALHSRRRAAPVGGEERDPVLARRIVEVVERSALPRSTPRSEELHAADVERPVEADADARALAVRRRDEHAVANEDPGRPAIGDSREVAVDADHRRLAREPALHRREGLLAEHGLVGEHGAKPVQADRPRPSYDSDRDGPTCGELNLTRVRDPGKELGGRLRRDRGRPADERGEEDKAGEQQAAVHGSARVPERDSADLQVLQHSNTERSACDREYAQLAPVRAPYVLVSAIGAPRRRLLGIRGAGDADDVRHVVEAPAATSSAAKPPIPKGTERIRSLHVLSTARAAPAVLVGEDHERGSPRGARCSAGRPHPVLGVLGRAGPGDSTERNGGSEAVGRCEPHLRDPLDALLPRWARRESPSTPSTQTNRFVYVVDAGAEQAQRAADADVR